MKIVKTYQKTIERTYDYLENITYVLNFLEHKSYSLASKSGITTTEALAGGKSGIISL